MKKELVLTTNNSGTRNISEIISSIKEHALRPIVILSKYYTKLMGEKISTRQSLLLLNAQVAAVFIIFPLSYSIILRILFIIWFATSVIQCKKGGL